MTELPTIDGPGRSVVPVLPDTAQTRMASFGWRVVRSDQRGVRAEKPGAAFASSPAAVLEAETIEELEEKVVAFEVARVEAQMANKGVTNI